MISIVDYGLGNVRAFRNMYKRLGIEACVVSNANDLSTSTKIVLPGVGSFDHAMELLDGSGMRAELDDLVLRKHVPVIGICVGMQMLATSSEEGTRAGLGWIEGKVRSLRGLPIANDMPLPHMGWNDVSPVKNSRLFEGLDHGSRFYFLHSFYFECGRPSDVAAIASYGGDFACAIASDNVYGVQFHPEKSHRWGTRLLQNFSEL